MSIWFQNPGHISLAPHSLYVCLTHEALGNQIHWSLYITDEHGFATKHHMEYGFYDRQVLQINQLRTTENGVQILVFTRITAFIPPRDNFNYPELLGKPVQLRFRMSSRGAEDIRYGGSCQAWVMRSLHDLRCLGYISLSAEQVIPIERYMDTRKREQLANRQIPFPVMVTTY